VVADQSQPRPSHRLIRRRLERIERRGIRPRDAAIGIVTIWVVAVVVLGVVEHLVDPKTFDTVWLGMWWGVQTVTTVGYGDVVPKDPVGQVIASFLMLGGLSLLAVVTGAITSAFVARAEADKREAESDPVIQRLDELDTQLKQLRAELSGSPGDTAR
jgi:voltage-gated potassium channel